MTEKIMIGHEKIIEDLKRLADAGELSHGYIFFGPVMVGKKLAAKELAEYLEDGSMDSRLRGNDRIMNDMMLVRPGEKGSIGIDAAREIKHFLWQKPNVSPRRTVIVDDAELLTTEAQNALLKITEEPPASSLVILITADPESILPTILSRLQSIYFGTVKGSEIAAWLISENKNSQLTKVKAVEFAKKSFGKPGLAIRLLGDEPFRDDLALAEKFLKSPKTTRRDLIKKIIEPDEFDLRKFLGAVMTVLAWHVPDGDANAKIMWHKALTLCARQTDFALNPRLQLEALMM